MELKSKLNIKWVADFGDSWTKIAKHPVPSKKADQKNKDIEYQVLNSADLILTTGKFIARELESLGAKSISVVSNGYDEDDLKFAEMPKPDKEFSILHAGNISQSTNQPNIWEAIRDLANEVDGFKDNLLIKLPGLVDPMIKKSISENGLDEYVKYYGYLPHNETLKMQKQARVLLLMVGSSREAKGVASRKLFEYLAAKKPILAIAPPKGETDQILNECNLGHVIDSKNKEAMKNKIFGFYNLYKQGLLNVGQKNMAHYSYGNIAKQLAEIFDGLVGDGFDFA